MGLSKYSMFLKRYQRYIALQLILPFLVITLTLSGIVWLAQALRFLDLIVNKGLAVSTFLHLSVLLLPMLLIIILPAALFSTVVYVYHKLISDSEAIVLKSTGLTRLQLASPALCVASMVAVIGYVLSLYVLPISYREFKDTQLFIRDNYASAFLQEGVFNNLPRGITIYFDERTSDGALIGLLVHDQGDPQNPATYMAEYGKLVRTKDGPRIYLKKAVRHDGKVWGSSDEYPLDLSLFMSEQSKRSRTVEEHYIHELFSPQEEVSEGTANKFKAEAHNRILWPLYSFTLTLLAVTTLFSGQFSRRGQAYRVLFAIGATVVLMGGAVGLKTASATTPALTVLMYVNVLLPILLCGYLLTSNRIIIGEKFALFMTRFIPKAWR